MFKQNDLTKKFLAVYDNLKNNSDIKSNSAFAKSINYTPQALYEIEKGKRDIPAHILYNFFKEYRVDPAVLFIDEEFEKYVNAKSKSYAYEKYNVRIHPIKVDIEGNERVTLVSQKASAGYLSSFQDENFMKQLPSISLPYGMEDESLYGFEIEGDSMESNLYAGDWAFCSLVEKLDWVKLNHVYVLVCEEGIVAKRIIEINLDEGNLTLRSDNESYSDYKVPLLEVKQIWKLRKSLRGKFPEFRSLNSSLKSIEQMLKKAIN